MKNAVGEFQRIVVLGGRSDIGRAIAVRMSTPFTRRIVLAGRSMVASDAEGFRNVLVDKGLTSIEVSVRQFDAADHGSHLKFFEELGPESVDLVIFAFGQLGRQVEIARDPVLASELVDVNMSGVVSSALACARVLGAQGSGHIVFISSVAGVRARKSNFVYGSTKAGMDVFAQGLADDLIDEGVRVTIVRPGFVHSSMTEGLDPAPFATTVDAVADRVVEGMRRGSGIIWVPGVLRYVFAILRVLPSAVWRRLPLK